MPKVDLKTPVWDDDKVLYRPGSGVYVPDALAQRLGLAPKTGDTEKRDSAPVDYPYADVLKTGGFNDWQAVQGASDDDLLAVDGIGPARLKEIREFKG